MRNAREPSCHVMSGTNGSIRDNTAEEQETLDKSDPRGPKFPHHEKNIVAQLKGLIPDVDVQTFTYTRQRNEDFFIGAFGYGKAAVCTIYVYKSFPSIFALLSLYSLSMC